MNIADLIYFAYEQPAKFFSFVAIIAGLYFFTLYLVERYWNNNNTKVKFRK